MPICTLKGYHQSLCQSIRMHIRVEYPDTQELHANRHTPGDQEKRLVVLLALMMVSVPRTQTHAPIAPICSIGHP
jgi:hypothetical protein